MEYKTFYRPVITDEPILSHCAGSHDPSYQVGSTTRCFIEKAKSSKWGDLRYQLNVPEAQFAIGCHDEVYGEEFMVCSDRFSYSQAVSPSKELEAKFVAYPPLVGERKRFFPGNLSKRAGELIGKPKQLFYQTFKLPERKGNIHIMVGGLKKSQGKYLIRVRVKELGLTVE